ncbi:MAG: cysteine desulfurase NifS [Oscillospiraceae bacterium]|jgi:cysteine desulfurase|nr:cysteine desulfurase NifS [Oscillospiraceae bacterium]
MKRFVYADNAATTKISEEVFKSMVPFLKENYGNASSLYKIGRSAKKALEQSREDVANCLGALPGEIFFTSGGSESNNWAIKCICEKFKNLGKNHIISSAFEHHAVLHTLKALEKNGFEVTYLDVYSDGIIRTDELKKAIKTTTALVTIMYANNEIGTVQPIDEIGRICKEKGVIFHTDAVQAISSVDFDLKNQNIDMLSLSAHKIYGPKGVGALYIKRGLFFPNLIEGGSQEKNRRAGTENIAGIVGLSTAMMQCQLNKDQKNKKLLAMRDRLIEGMLKIDESILNGHRTKRLPSNVNVSFKGVEGESLLLRLDSEGISTSSGSACTSGSLDPSHVLLAIGLTHEVAHGSLRISLSDKNTEEDIDYILKCLPKVVNGLRNMSPLWEKIKKMA